MVRTSLIAMTLLAACQLAMPHGTVRTSTRSEPDPAAAGSSSSSSAYTASQPATSGQPSTVAPAASEQQASDTWHDDLARKRALDSGQIFPPNVMGLTFDEARVAFEKAGFTQTLEKTFNLQCQNPHHKMDRVDCQEPMPGVAQGPGAPIRVQVWDGREIRYVSPTEADQVVGMTVDAAQAKLHAMGLGAKCRVMEQPSDSSCADGRVCTVIVRSHECTLVVNKAYEIAGPK